MIDAGEPPDIDPLIAFEERRCSTNLTVRAVETTTLKGGYASKALYRHDVSFTREDGRRHRSSFVQKFCKVSEIRMLQELGAKCAAPALPEVVAAKRSDECPEDPAANWFISPLYEGRELTFDDPVPQDVVTTLAKVHASLAEEAKSGRWTWVFDLSHFERILDEAVEALASADLFQQTVADHTVWVARLQALRGSQVFAEATASLPKTLVHGDMHPGNIIVCVDGRSVVIDWGNVCVAPAFLDISNIIPIDSPNWDLYCRTYHEAGGVVSDQTALRGFLWAQAATGLQYLPWIARHHTDAPRVINQILNAERRLAKVIS